MYRADMFDICMIHRAMQVAGRLVPAEIKEKMVPVLAAVDEAGLTHILSERLPRVDQYFVEVPDKTTYVDCMLWSGIEAERQFDLRIFDLTKPSRKFVVIARGHNDYALVSGPYVLHREIAAAYFRSCDSLPRRESWGGSSYLPRERRERPA